MIWLKLGIPVVIIALAIWHFKNDQATAEELGAVQAKYQQCDVDLLASGSKVSTLNERIRTANKQKLDQLVKADEQIAIANQAAAQARLDRQTAREELTRAQQRYREALATDENLQAYSRTVVPVAVLDRLRSANGEAVPDR